MDGSETQSIISVNVPSQGPFGIHLQEGPNGFAAEIINWQRIDGKYGPVKKNGNVHIGYILCGINDTPLDKIRFREAMRMLKDPGIDKRVLQFLPKEIFITERFSYFFGKIVVCFDVCVVKVRGARGIEWGKELVEPINNFHLTSPNIGYMTHI